ncbi:MAG: glycosyltransferase involved in cell wall biosynthesis [Myxococcota bacterium]
MKVVHVIAPGPLAGAERLVIAGVAALEGSSAEVTLVVLVDARGPENGHRFVEAARAAGASRVVPLPCRARVDLLTVARLRRLLTRSVDVVHVHGYKTLTYAFLARSQNLPVVVTHHGDTGFDSRVRLYEAVATRLYRRAQAVIAVSKAIAQDLQRAGVSGARVHRIANCLGLTAPPENASRVGDHLLFLGRLSPEKGIDILFRALARPEASDLTLRIAGDGPERDALVSLAAELGLDHRITWLGFVDDVKAELAAAGAVVLPSRREGLPMTVIEAASWGKPVVASNVGGISEVVIDADNGLLVPAEDVEALASALEQWASSAEAFAERANAASIEIRDRYGAKRWAGATESLYAELIAERRCAA